MLPTITHGRCELLDLLLVNHRMRQSAFETKKPTEKLLHLEEMNCKTILSKLIKQMELEMLGSVQHYN